MKVEKVGAYWVADCFGMQAKAKTSERAVEKLCIDACKRVRHLEVSYSKLMQSWASYQDLSNLLRERLHVAEDTLKRTHNGEDHFSLLSDSFVLSKRITELEDRLAKYEDPFAHNG